MSKRKKHFPCGHVGFGQYCHICQSKKQTDQSKKSVRRQRTHQKDPIDLSMLPSAQLQRARTVLTKLKKHVPIHRLGGRRLTKTDHMKIVFNLGYRYRMLCKETPEGVIPLEVCSHETYNQKCKEPL